MKWRKAPQSLIAAFLEALPEDARVEQRQMFGYPCCFVNGNLSSGLFQEHVLLRLAEADRVELTALGAQPFAPVKGRVMKEYLLAPEEIVASDHALAEWVGRAFAHALALPPKPPKSPRQKAPAKKAATRAASTRGRPAKPRTPRA